MFEIKWLLETDIYLGENIIIRYLNVNSTYDEIGVLSVNAERIVGFFLHRNIGKKTGQRAIN